MQAIFVSREMKKVLMDLLSTSNILDAGLWLDGIYTPLDENFFQGDWTKGREVYFKIEARVEKEEPVQP